MPNVHCPDCNVEMEVGYLPELGDGLHARQMVWTTGAPVPKTVFGLKVGAGIVKSSDPEARPVPILAYRCPHCGLLRLYAIPAEPTATD